MAGDLSTTSGPLGGHHARGDAHRHELLEEELAGIGHPHQRDLRGGHIGDVNIQTCSGGLGDSAWQHAAFAASNQHLLIDLLFPPLSYCCPTLATV